MPRIARVSFARTADYGTFFLHDPSILTESPEDDTARTASRQHVITAGRHRAYLRTGQRVAQVNVTIEVWDAEPEPPGADGWETWDEATLAFPSGRVMVQATGDGPVYLSPGDQRDVPLPDGACTARIRAYGAGLDVATLVDDVYTDSAGEPFETLYARLRELDGRERYLLHLWPGR